MGSKGFSLLPSDPLLGGAVVRQVRRPPLAVGACHGGIIAPGDAAVGKAQISSPMLPGAWGTVQQIAPSLGRQSKKMLAGGAASRV
jgi:hypothetical protein